MNPKAELIKEYNRETKKLKNLKIMKKVMYVIYVVIFLITVGLFFTSCEKDVMVDDTSYECVITHRSTIDNSISKQYSKSFKCKGYLDFDIKCFKEDAIKYGYKFNREYDCVEILNF